MLDEKVIYTYEITPLTMAILSKRNEQGNVMTRVLEEDREYSVFTTPTKMIDYACKFYGSSLKGRLEGTKGITKITHKAPIAIDPLSGMYFFPTASPTNKNCSWLNHSHIKTINPINNNAKTIITFKNGKTITVDVSFGSMLNQQHRTAQFRYALDDHMKIIRDAMEE